MADEWVLVDRLEDPIDYVVADATGIEKGALLKLTDSGTAILATAAGDMVAGVASSEKIANDGRTQLGVYKRGRFRAVASGAVTVGEPIAVAAGATNRFAGVQGQSGAAVIGTAEYTAAVDEAGQVFLNVGVGINPN